MAQPVVAAVANKLADYLQEEATLLHGVRDEVEWLERELQGMVCFLKDADSKQKGDDERVRNWVKDVREVAYDVEDVIETFMLKVSRDTSIHRCASLLTSVIPRHKVGMKIEMIKKRIVEISTRRVAYGIDNLGESRGQENNFLYENLQSRRRLSPHYYDDSSIIGLEEDKKMILKQLLDEEKRRCVISIVGMGGLGKTTLAKKVYNCREVIDEFQCRAWVSVSQDYRVIELLKKIIKAVTGVEDAKIPDEEDLKRKLYGLLGNQGRYLIVMDDVWRKEVWERIGTSFPDAGNGSRVIFTTRHIDVAKSADPAMPPYPMRLLDKSESRKLFLKKVYPYQDIQTFPNELEDVGQELANKCHGLPLALVVLGGLLSVKEKNHHEWSRVLRSSNWQFTQGKECLTILALSYEDLPYELKPCFLYIGSFPEDSEIPARRLIRLWIAEGFISQLWPKSREERARDFLLELVQRCMIQVAHKEYDGTIKSIRIHDLLRDLCVDEAREDGFLMVKNNWANDRPTSSGVITARRLALYDHRYLECLNPSTEHTRTEKLHTLLGCNFQGRYSMISKSIGQALYGLKLLRVIDVEIQVGKFFGNTVLPKEITTMIHLRYLRWSIDHPGSVSLPSVKNLRNLQTLDVQGLTVDSTCGIGSLKGLQELTNIRAGRWITKALSKLTNLQLLNIWHIKPWHEKDLVRSLRKLDRLESLSLHGRSIPAEVPMALSNQHQLRALELIGPFSQTKRLLFNSGFPPNLTRLALEKSNLEQDPMAALEKMPHLIDLALGSSTYLGRHMSCCAGGFPRLERMSLNDLPELEDWIIEDTAMRSLAHLTILDCRKLKALPEGLQHVTSLQELQLIHMPSVFKDRVRENEGEDWYKIQHVPSTIVGSFFDDSLNHRDPEE